ncbi:MAG: hypothetical protein V1708_04535 [Candidatus Micrarchaeota archaeon]
MPFFLAVLSFVLALSSSGVCASLQSLSFNHSAPSYSAGFSIDSLAGSLAIPPSLAFESSYGEFSGAFAANFSATESALVSVNSSSPLFSASGGLVMQISDGCSDPQHGGRDKCELAGFTGPGDFHFCSKCEYFHPMCGNLYYQDWCYRYFPTYYGELASSFGASNHSLSLSIAAPNASCALSSLFPPLNCSFANFSAAIDSYPAFSSPPNLSLVRSFNSSWQVVSTDSMQSYISALANYQSHYSLSIADAASFSASLNAALAALLQNASGNYSGAFNYSCPQLSSPASIALSFNALAFNFTALRGRPALASPDSFPQSAGSTPFFKIPLRNSGYAADNFSILVSCNDSPAFNSTLYALPGQTVSLEIPLLNATPPRACVIFAQSAGNPLLNDSIYAAFDAFIPPCPPGFECCSPPDFAKRACASQTPFNSSGGFYYLQAYSCENFSCVESNSSFLYFPTATAGSPVAPSSSSGVFGWSGSSGSQSFSRSPASPSPVSPPEPDSFEPPSAAVVVFIPVKEDAGGAIFASEGIALGDDGLAASGEATASVGAASPVNPSGPQPALPSSPSSLTALSSLSFHGIRLPLLLLASLAVASFCFFYFQPALRLSKRFNNGHVIVRLQSMQEDLDCVVLSDFVPGDAVFETPPDSLRDTILGRLAEWRLRRLAAGECVVVSYSCGLPCEAQACADFSRNGEMHRLLS